MDQNEQPPPATPDAPDQETMEQIRRRRLQKLGGPPASSSSTAASSSSPTTTTSTTPTNDKIETPPATQGPSKVAEKQNENAKPQAVESQTKINITPAPQQSASASLPPRKQTPSKEQTIEDYADRVLSHIFRVTVDPTKTSENNGHTLAFLPNLSQELSDEGAPLKLSIDRLEEAIMEAATAFPHDKPLLDYLLPCWKRVNKNIKLQRNPTQQKNDILKEARRLCFSNCIFALTVPELFSREPNPKHDTLAPWLLREFESDGGLCMEFYTEALSRVEEDDTILPLFTRSMVDISKGLAKMTMDGNFRPSVQALSIYAKFPPLLNALAEDPLFHMAQSAKGIEKHTILGPFFRISPLQPEVTESYFQAPRTMDSRAVKLAQDSLRATLSNHQLDLRNIINAFIRASPKTRNKVLDWFAHIMNVNHKRRAIQVDPNEVSSDGFLMNVTVVLDCLCEPFMDSTFSKIGRIDVDYFRRNPRVDIKEETKMNADQSQSDAFYAKKADGESNFITEIFFLTLAAHHYGSEATNAKMESLDKDIKFFMKNIARMEAERPKLAAQPFELAKLDIALKRYIQVLEKAMSLKFAIEGVLLDEKMQSRSLQFMRYATVWLLRVASQTDYNPDKQLKLPLPEAQPDAFSCLPEYALQDVVDNFKFVFRYLPQIILSAVGEEMIVLCLTFLESSEYVKNPGLKSSLITLLYQGTWPTYHLKKGVLGDLMTNAKFSNQYLLHAVMKFYIECESTGVSSQFYDKFNIRYEIFQIIRCVWSNDLYKQQLTQASKTNRSFFVRFVNLLMNDATWVLDEALSRFPKIHDLQMNLKDQTLAQADREKMEEDLRTTESMARNYMNLSNETVSMMKLFTTTLTEAFTMPEIVQRLAGMLDYNLDILTGPKSRSLKVENPEKYSFNPKVLLPEIVDIYINLGGVPAFVEAVAGDGRSYKPETMEMTSRILRSKHLKDPAELNAWDELCKKFVEAKVVIDRAELDFDDAPPEFEDPIMGDLMKDPVLLPSKHIVDRSTIVQHLLSDPKDPFTRQPMTIDDVIPDVELKEKIEKWKAERIAEARSKAKEQVAAAGESMDTTEG